MTDQELSLARVVLSAGLFYAGCFLAYRTDGLRGGLVAYLLIVSGLVCGLWDRLWY